MTETHAPYDAVVVMTTVASSDEAIALVRTLPTGASSHCGTLFPGARSLYVERKVADEQEVVVMLRRAARIAALESAFAEVHPYKFRALSRSGDAGLGSTSMDQRETTLALT